MFQIHRLWGNSLVFSYFLSVPGPTLSEKMCSFYFANTYFLTVLDFPEEVARADVSGKAWKCSEKERGSEFEYLWGMGSSLGARLNGSLLWWVTVHSVLFDSWGGWPQSQQFKPRPVQRKKKKKLWKAVSSSQLCCLRWSQGVSWGSAPWAWSQGCWWGCWRTYVWGHCRLEWYPHRLSPVRGLPWSRSPGVVLGSVCGWGIWDLESVTAHAHQNPLCSERNGPYSGFTGQGYILSWACNSVLVKWRK